MQEAQIPPQGPVGVDELSGRCLGDDAVGIGLHAGGEHRRRPDAFREHVLVPAPHADALEQSRGAVGGRLHAEARQDAQCNGLLLRGRRRERQGLHGRGHVGPGAGGPRLERGVAGRDPCRRPPQQCRGQRDEPRDLPAARDAVGVVVGEDALDVLAGPGPVPRRAGGRRREEGAVVREEQVGAVDRGGVGAAVHGAGGLVGRGGDGGGVLAALGGQRQAPLPGALQVRGVAVVHLRRHLRRGLRGVPAAGEDEGHLAGFDGHRPAGRIVGVPAPPRHVLAVNPDQQPHPAPHHLRQDSRGERAHHVHGGCGGRVPGALEPCS